MSNIKNIYKNCFIQHDLFEKDMIKLSDHSWQQPDAFVEEFKEVLLFENIMSSNQLYDKMYGHSILRDDDYHTTLKKWRQRTGNKIFECIFDELSKARDFYKSEFIDGELLELKNTIKKESKEIQTLLEEK